MLLLLLLPLHLTLLSAPTTATDPYEVLRSNDLPIGLLPSGIRNFSIDADGNFNASLDAPCTAKFESEVSYNDTIAGTISVGEIANLSGIAAQDLFLWFQVRAIRRYKDSFGIIHFDVGVVDKSYPASLFEFPPYCSPDSSSRSSASDAMLREGYNIAEVLSESQSGKLRYELDQDNTWRADI